MAPNLLDRSGSAGTDSDYSAVAHLTGMIADPYRRGSLSWRARQRRWVTFLDHFPGFERMRVVDLGGVPDAWSSAPVKPRELLLVNLQPHEPDSPWMKTLVGDVCQLPDSVFERPFDLVYSNSTIQLLGRGHAGRAAFADAVHRLGGRHWVQTPNRSFPVDPHWMFPGFQFLPVRARVAITRRWPFGHRQIRDPAKAIESVLTCDLLSVTEMEALFPKSTITREHFLGFPKSLIAVRTFGARGTSQRVSNRS